LKCLTPGSTYLTGDKPIADAALSCFRVLATMAYRPQRLKRFLRCRRVGRLEVKKRGVALDPQAVRRGLALRGDNEMTLILTPIQCSTIAILAERIG
jgi:hypothetical protein